MALYLVELISKPFSSLNYIFMHVFPFTIDKLKNTIISYLSFYLEQKLIDNIICNNERSSEFSKKLPLRQDF